MARIARVEYKGACYHIINRGNFRQNIFAKPGAAESFEKALYEAIEKYNWKLSAYVIMGDHYHLALELTEPNLSLGMKWLQGTWAMRNKLFLKRVGKPFQGRYKSILIEPGVLKHVVSFIHLNPRRAGLEKKGKLGSYRWSSLHVLPHKRRRPVNLLPDQALLSLGGIKDSGYAWKKYFQYLEALAENEPLQRELEFEKLSKGWCRGNKAFRKEQSNNLKEIKSALARGKSNKSGKADLGDQAEKLWEKRLRRYAKDFGISLSRLGRLKSDPQKVILATLMKRRTSASNGWLAERLKMGHPASVSQFVGRFSRGKSRELKQVDVYLSKSKL